ncbi:MAG TPA: Wzz/FepE/Etk N-terminal domain-containing protein, partial [Allocoleopsis sp.]
MLIVIAHRPLTVIAAQKRNSGICMEQVFMNLSPQQLAKLRGEAQPNGKTPAVAQVPKPLSIEDDDFNVRQVVATFRRRAWILAGVTGTAAVSITAWNLSRPEIYQGKFRLLVEPVSENKDLTASIAVENLTQQKQDDGLDYETQIQVLTSETLLEPIVEKIQQKYPEIDYKQLVSNLQVSRPEDSKILEFSYSSHDPEEIKFVLSQLAKDYVQYSVEDRQTNVKRAIEFADQQIQEQQQQVTQWEGELEAFRRQNNLNDPTEQTTSLSQQMSSLLGQQRSNRVQLEAAQTLYANLQQQIGVSPEQAVVIAALSEAPVYQQLLTQLREVESQIATQSAVFTENAPEMQLLQDQRSELMPLVQAEAQRILGESGLGGQVDAQQIGFQGSISQDLIKQYV